MTLRKKLLCACLCLLLALPALARAAEVKPTAEQKKAAEKFITALKGGNHKAAYEVFYTEIQHSYPFPIFVDIQKNVTKTMGDIISYAYKSVRKAETPQGKIFVLPSKTYIYDLVYQKEKQKVKIPLELTFGSGDAENQLVSYKYLKDQMSNGEEKK